MTGWDCALLARSGRGLLLLLAPAQLLLKDVCALMPALTTALTSLPLASCPASHLEPESSAGVICSDHSRSTADARS